MPLPDPDPEPEGQRLAEPEADPPPLADPEALPDPPPLADPEALPDPSQSSLMSRTSAPSSSFPQADPTVIRASDTAAAVMSRLRVTCPPGSTQRAA
jgi:hypothetical protein